MGDPRPKKVNAVKNAERIPARRLALHNRCKHPPFAVVHDQRRIRRIDVGQQRRFMNPVVRKRIGAIQIDRARGAAFRDHPDLAAVLENKGIGKMMRRFQHRARRRRLAIARHGGHRNDGFAGRVILLLAKKVMRAANLDDKRIGVISPAVVSEALETGLRQRVRARDAIFHRPTVSDRPPRRPRAEFRQPSSRFGCHRRCGEPQRPPRQRALRRMPQFGWHDLRIRLVDGFHAQPQQRREH